MYVRSSPENDELARLYERSRVYSVEVYAAGEILSIELYFVITGFLFAILDKGIPAGRVC